MVVVVPSRATGEGQLIIGDGEGEGEECFNLVVYKGDKLFGLSLV